MTDRTHNYEEGRCQAWVSEDWGPGTSCQFKGKHDRSGHKLCGVHARVFDRWERQGRPLSMATFWWGWTDAV